MSKAATRDLTESRQNGVATASFFTRVAGRPTRATLAARRDGAYPSEDVLAACRELKKKGYELALDDVVAEARIELGWMS